MCCVHGHRCVAEGLKCECVGCECGREGEFTYDTVGVHTQRVSYKTYACVCRCVCKCDWWVCGSLGPLAQLGVDLGTAAWPQAGRDTA